MMFTGAVAVAGTLMINMTIMCMTMPDIMKETGIMAPAR